MGVVYRAEDTRLGRTVALKFLPPQLLHDDESKERFIREAKAASALDHPNVCTIYEIDETDDGQLFIAMAFYEGETLEERLTRESLEIEEAVEIVRQIASGLAKTHERGLIHRDIKPANVFLTEDSGPAGHVKLLDFGLAKGVGDMSALTRTGSTLGTPAYMSPEQTRGEGLDVRTDLWSLGVMLYQLLTGRLPFAGTNIPALIYAIHSREPEELTALRPGVPAELQAIVSKLLEKQAADRYASCHELVADLGRFTGRSSASGPIEATYAFPGPVASSTTPMTAGPAIPAETAARPASRHGWLAVAAVAAVAVLAWLSWVLVRPGPKAEPEAAAGDGRPFVAVCFFDNPSGDPELDWLRTGLADMLVTDLSQGQDFRVLSTSRMYQILRELDLLDEKLAFTVASDVAERAGTDLVVLGSVVRSGGMLRIDIKIQEAGTGNLIASKEVEGGGEDSLFSLVDDLSYGIRQGLEMPGAADSSPETDLATVTTSSIAAYRAYVEGLRLHWQLKNEEAVSYYRKAVEIDPEFALAYARLTAVYSNLGWPNWREYAQKALEHAERLTPGERLYVEGVFYNTQYFRLNDAVTAFEKAVEINPDHFSARNNLGLVYGRLERYEEAVALAKESLRMGDRFRGVPINLADYYCGLGDFEKAQEALGAVEDPDDPAIITARGVVDLRWGRYDSAAEWLERAWNLEQQPDRLLRLCALQLLRDDARGAVQVSELPIESKNPGLPISALVCRQLAASQGGHVTEAATLAKRLIEQAPTPFLRSVYGIWAGRLELQRGRPEAALEFLAASLEGAPERQPYSIALFYSGLAELQRGRTDAARELATELGALAAKLGYPVEKRRDLHLRALIDLAEGDPQAAVAQLEEAVAMLPAQDLWGLGVPDGVPLWYSLATAYRTVGEMERSADNLRRIVGSHDSRWFYPILYVRSLYLLGEHHRELGEEEQAGEYFRRFLRNWDGGELEPEWVAEAKRFLARG